MVSNCRRRNAHRSARNAQDDGAVERIDGGPLAPREGMHLAERDAHHSFAAPTFGCENVFAKVMHAAESLLPCVRRPAVWSGARSGEPRTT